MFLKLEKISNLIFKIFVAWSSPLLEGEEATLATTSRGHLLENCRRFDSVVELHFGQCRHQVLTRKKNMWNKKDFIWHCCINLIPFLPVDIHRITCDLLKLFQSSYVLHIKIIIMFRLFSQTQTYIEMSYMLFGFAVLLL